MGKVNWGAFWDQFEKQVREDASWLREDLLDAAQDLAYVCTGYAGGISWEALQRAWSRRTGESILEHVVKPDYSYTQPEARGLASGTATLAGRMQNAVEEREVAEELARAPQGRKHLVIPDTQVRPGVPTQHFVAIGKYIVAKQPEVVVHLGDHWDMPSLSDYESRVRKAHRGSCKVEDIEAGNQALEVLENELEKGGYQPKRKILLRGNHDCYSEHGRVGRYLAEHPDDRKLFERVPFHGENLGWEVVPFLDSIEVDGVTYSHLFPFTTKGTVSASSVRMGAASAAAQVRAMMRSCTAGHKQGLDTAIHFTPQRTYRSVIAGSCYLHEESYLGPARYWRGVLLKHGVKDGNYDLCEVGLDWLMRRHG